MGVPDTTIWLAERDLVGASFTGQPGPPLAGGRRTLHCQVTWISYIELVCCGTTLSLAQSDLVVAKQGCKYI
ncbi:hypothetical protein ABKV19_005721 [Rosa sericea]